MANCVFIIMITSCKDHQMLFFSFFFFFFLIWKTVNSLLWSLLGSCFSFKIILQMFYRREYNV